MIYCCPKHDQEFAVGSQEGCPDCQRILKRMSTPKKYPDQELKHTRMSVYWSHNDDALSQGRVVENLEHRPVHFGNKDQFRDYLKRHRIREGR
jgi:TfoX/Sxy family transcriptional regulator of competence genes